MLVVLTVMIAVISLAAIPTFTLARDRIRSRMGTINGRTMAKGVFI